MLCFPFRHIFNTLHTNIELNMQKWSSYNIMMKKQKNKYDHKIVTVKYLELIDQNKIWLILTLPQKCANFLDMHLCIAFLNFFTKFQIYKVQTLNFINLEFEQNCSYIGGADTYPLQIVTILLNLTVQERDIYRSFLTTV